MPSAPMKPPCSITTIVPTARSSGFRSLSAPARTGKPPFSPPSRSGWNTRASRRSRRPWRRSPGSPACDCSTPLSRSDIVARLAHNAYGKSRVRLTKVVRRPDGVHTLDEFSVQIQLEGAFERVYTHGDNAACIPTDTMKNTVYALAKQHDFDCPELFGMILGEHFLQKFPHVSAATAAVEQTLWERIPVAGRPHDHSFANASNTVRTAVVRQERGRIDLQGGLRDLEVIKTTRSGFTGFLKDEYTTLKETTDRIFGTSVEAAWTFATMV